MSTGLPDRVALVVASLLASAPAWASEVSDVAAGIGDISWPGALVVVVWLVTRWRPEVTVHLDRD